MSKAPSMLNVVNRVAKVLDELPIKQQKKCLEALELVIADKEDTAEETPAAGDLFPGDEKKEEPKAGQPKDAKQPVPKPPNAK